ncbi:MarR family winged helix-turn-helix transcriptional regulator [Patulibacter defluvii]|uniref:MarR family winged helix-turn-helix transcriptional regulator n=1 Tax=Patulibacter defluvii TaxID=3095358 RepID=UPI002A75B24E|nr:MarR family winged helix-turn-helix transcriptional regulator [Patulibacter sp. DM4]
MATNERRDDLAWLLTRAGHAVTGELAAALAPLGLTPRDLAVLRAASADARTQIELARATGLDKTTMVVAVDALEAAGLAERRASPHDRRARVIAVTAAGDAALARAEAVASRLQERTLAALPAAQRQPFLAALAQIASK